MGKSESFIQVVCFYYSMKEVNVGCRMVNNAPFSRFEVE